MDKAFSFVDPQDAVKAFESTKYLLNNFADYVDSSRLDFRYAIALIAFNPIFCNVVARAEYKTHFLTKLTGSAYKGCYLLAFTIFSLGIFRDHVYHNALQNQPTY